MTFPLFLYTRRTTKTAGSWILSVDFRHILSIIKVSHHTIWAMQSVFDVSGGKTIKGSTFQRVLDTVGLNFAFTKTDHAVWQCLSSTKQRGKLWKLCRVSTNFFTNRWATIEFDVTSSGDVWMDFRNI